MPSIIRRTRRCTHTHVSGRRCEVRVPKKDLYGTAILFCGNHKTPDCEECKGMMEAFKPPKGWHI